MGDQLGDDSPRRSWWQRLDTIGKKAMAVVAAVGVIVSTIAGVRALLPKGAKQPEDRATLAGLKLHVERLRSFRSRDRLIAADPPVNLASGPVLVASSRVAADAALVTQASTEPGTPAPTEPVPTPPSTQPGTRTSTQPATVVGTTSVPGTPSGKGVLCVEDTNLSAGTGAITSTTPSTSANLGSAPCQVVYAIPRADLHKSIVQLRQEADTLGHQLSSLYELSITCDRQPPPQACPLARGIHPRTIAPTGPNRAQRMEATKLALIREELKQLSHTKAVQGPAGKRDPLGVQLDYGLRVCGFHGKSLRVFWTLFDSNRPPRIPYYWDSNRLANTVERRSSRCENVFPSFWVPVPTAKGRFTVVLSVYDEDGVRRGPPVESKAFSS